MASAKRDRPIYLPYTAVVFMREDMDIFYIMFDCVVVGIIASEASEKKTNKNPRESRGGSV